jgi:hypothetical protein
LEDQAATSHASAGQLIMYMSNSVGDLSNGKLYALKEMTVASWNFYEYWYFGISRTREC